MNDALLALDRTVIVELDGGEVRRGTVEPSVKHLPDGYDAAGDPRRLFRNELPFTR